MLQTDLKIQKKKIYKLELLTGKEQDAIRPVVSVSCILRVNWQHFVEFVCSTVSTSPRELSINQLVFTRPSCINKQWSTRCRQSVLSASHFSDQLDIYEIYIAQTLSHRGVHRSRIIQGFVVILMSNYYTLS